MNRLCTLLFTVVLLALVALPGITAAAVSGDESVASVIAWPNGIEWQPHVFYDQLVLTVSGPGDTYFQQTFPADAAPVFDLLDNDAIPFPDGSCTYELLVIPDVPPEVFPSPADGREPPDGSFPEDPQEGGKPPTQPLVQSGSFTIQGGEIVTAGDTAEVKKEDSEDSTRNPDFVINDDLIVDGSTCIGFDCVNGESFGFDTLRLKENNLRIKFDDTSVAASYPRNDWQLTANDSANGGLSKFSIDDITGSRTPFTIEAGARSHSLYVDDGGRIGIRTNTPSTEIHVKDGDTPTLRLDQDGSSGFAPQTWDVAANETNFFIRDVTNGSTLPLRIRPGAPSSSIFIDTDGDVGIGTASPSFPLELKRTTVNAGMLFNRNDTAKLKLNMTSNQGQIGTQTNHPLKLVADNVNIISVNQDGTLDMSDGGSYNGTWNPSCSREYKENIESLSADEALEAFQGLSPVRYNYKLHKDEDRVGFIAEDVPDLVAMNGRKNLSTLDIVAILTKVVQEQQKAIEELQGKITELEQE